ncbi:MAG: N-formylglutamate amidohydrolase [Alphaproteobacteria bacterium]|nr:N-formylglutamate amidohydrolase [Alphaproteobacteria bacterium]
MSDKILNFRVNYKGLKIFDEFNINTPRFPIVLSSPHAGEVFPPEFLANSALSLPDLRSSHDCYVTELIKPASDAGMPLISMNISRTFVDVNRDKIELDDAMFYNAPPRNGINSRRCRVGLGVLHRVVYPNQNIYAGLLDYNEALERIKKIYDVYHHRLTQLVEKCVRQFGVCYIIDCHSMPSMICNIMNEAKPLDFCICNLFDESCPSEVSAYLRTQLERQQYRVECNRPYSGAYITFNYCQPRRKIYTLQLEVNRQLYMNEKTYDKNADFQDISTYVSETLTNLGHFLLDLKK